jgi:hypothetical protein
MRFLVIFFLAVTVVFSGFGCKTKKSAVAESPYTDTLKLQVNYQQDSVQVFVKKIIVSDSLYIMDADESPFYDIVYAEQKDTLLFITLRMFKTCEEYDFDLYQSAIVLKTYPARVRLNLYNNAPQNSCEEKLSMLTLVFDLRPILRDHLEAHLLFKNFSQIATVKRKPN